ncbi:RimJ/RimL family protein N-acetyltransferase [Micromonospora pisi]|uniref:RimJ/RimL family protein N-acetyltransferase n=1 Tax=Micromonospora pisi TaxID=589240 RepID=A0A495JVY7_9ACTN|nr:GNAT family protein [Micromonospora pisi]RKR93193.1 RimJ/RimL family protein N-acetyltransferase [Micromonospora pisi]
MLRPDYPIKTGRLLLRPFEERDLADLHALTSDPEVVRYLYWEVHDEAGTRDALSRQMAQGELTGEGQRLVLAVQLRATGQVIGQVVLKWVSVAHHQGELGFVFNRAFHGKGYAREAAEVGLRLGFEELGLHRVTAACDVLNEPSWRLMERLGMRREAHFVEDEIFKGQWGEQLIYAILAREWRSRNASRPASSATTG